MELALELLNWHSYSPLFWSTALHILLWTITYINQVMSSDLLSMGTAGTQWPWKSFAPALRLLAAELKCMAILYTEGEFLGDFLANGLASIHWANLQMSIQIQRNCEPRISHYRQGWDLCWMCLFEDHCKFIFWDAHSFLRMSHWKSSIRK